MNFCFRKRSSSAYTDIVTAQEYTHSICNIINIAVGVTSSFYELSGIATNVYFRNIKSYVFIWISNMQY